MSSSCLIKPIPALCVGASAVSVGSGSSWYLSENITYAATAAIYGIGKLATQLPSFNPSWDALAVYGFNSATVGSSWSAEQYLISGGAIVGGSGTIISGAACATDSFNTADEQYTLISWDGLASNGWTGAGGYCLCDNTCSSGYVAPGGAIASPPTTINTLNATVAAPSTPSGRGGGGSSGDGCNVFIGVVTTAPAGGFGVGAVQSAVFSTDGSYTTTGADISVVFPYIS